MKQQFETVNSGLVILAPFLPQYFMMLDVQPARSQGEQVQAALLLHYLVTGELMIAEWQLTLPKLLSGIDINEPVAAGLELSDRIVSESDELLQIVITQWSHLGLTKTEGLREAFLKRSGTIEVSESHAVLHIPPQPQDVLLDGIPWSFRLIRFPWMRQQLNVDW